VRGCDDDYLLQPDLFYERCTDLLVAPAENEPLGTDRADDDPGIRVFFRKSEEFLLIAVGSNKPPVPDCVHPKERLFRSQPPGQGFGCCAGPDDIERPRQEDLVDELRNRGFCPFLISLFVYLF
jgi:hypothetical protein